MNNPEYVRVLFRRPNRLVIGPLGCFTRGQKLTIDDVDHVVVAIDHDFAAIAAPAAHLRTEFERTATEGMTPAEWLERFAHERSCDPPSAATLDAQRGMIDQAQRNRREYVGTA